MTFPARAAALMAVSALLVACGGSDPAASVSPQPGSEPETVGCELPEGPVVVAGIGRANMPGVAITPALGASIAHARDIAQRLTVIDSDSRPSELGVVEFAIPKADSERYVEEQLRQRTERAQRGILTARPNDPEADPLGALNMAADYVMGSGTIVLIDSGLSTHGILDHREEGMLLADPNDVAIALKQGGHLPDLSEKALLFVGLGRTAQPQSALDEASAKRVVAQWQAIAAASDAACVFIDETPLSGDPAGGLPEVSEIDVPETALPPFDVPEPPEDFALGQDTLPFLPDSDEFVDPVQAREVLAPLADYLAQSGRSVRLEGSTATGGSEEYQDQLSRDRAQAVADVLVGLGVEESRIEVVGLGAKHPEREEDLDENGDLRPGPAAKNRAVFVKIS